MLRRRRSTLSVISSDELLRVDAGGGAASTCTRSSRSGSLAARRRRGSRACAGSVAARQRAPAAGLVEHECADRHDQPGLLGQRDELGRARRGRAPGAASARAPRRRTTSPVASATIGWYSTTNSPRVDRLLELLLEAVAAQDRGRACCGSKSSKRALARAAWPGTSRRRRRGSARPRRGRLGVVVAMPTLSADADRLVAGRARALANASRIRSATTRRRPPARRRRSSMTANSSPPRRATVSLGRTHARRRSATATSSCVADARGRACR